MEALIKKAKEIFSQYNRLETLDICTYCCVSDDDARALFNTKRYEISAHLMYEYNSTAKSGYTLETAKELKYFLPRLLELVVENAEVHHSEELYLHRCSMVPFEAWTKLELDFLKEFANAYISYIIEDQNYDYYQLEDAMVMLSYLPIDISSVFCTWRDNKHPNATLALADIFYYHHFDNVAKGFGSDSGFTGALDHFFSKKENRDIWIQKIEDLVWKIEHPITEDQSLQLDAVHFKLTHY